MADDDVLFAERLALIGRHGAAFAAVVESDLSAPVDGCPGWTVAHLCMHVGGVLHLWTEIARGAPDPSRVGPPVAPPSPSGLGHWCAERAAACSAALASAGPTAPVWTFWGAGKACDAARRVVHELAVHAVDLADARGARPEVDPAVASDGIDEFCEVFLPRRRESMPGPGGSVHVHCTDTAGEWTVREDDGVLSVAREHAKGTCALRGEALALLCVLWRRRPLGAVEVFGSIEVAERFVAGTDLG